MTPAPTGPGAPRLSDEECLDEVARLRFGEAPCRACGARAGHERVSPRVSPRVSSRASPRGAGQAYACRACGMKVFPLRDTPFAKPGPSLAQWFLAIHAAANGATGAGALRRALRGSAPLDRAGARELAAGIAALRAAETPRAETPRAEPPRAEAPSAEPPWSAAITAFVATRAAAAGEAAPRAQVSDRETVGQTLRELLRLPELERRPLLGVAGIAMLTLVGAGLGWLAVPAPQEPEPELVQATAILSLGEEKPVIVVTPEVARGLYDVSDVDADPSSPLASTIRVAPAGSGGAPDTVAGASAIPAVKLSDGAARSLVAGDTAGVRARAGNRPELAAYDALARELEAKGPRNPDELLVFGPMRIRRYLVEKIVRAARETTTDPVLLMAIADKESSFQTEVQAQTSSASGLFQFIEKTWLGVVREFGARHGLEAEARTIAAGDPAAAERARILDLRRDAYLSAVLAAEMLKRDSLRIGARIGRNLTGGEIYLVHFLGPDGAERFLDAVERKPDTVAADLLPKPAAANLPIFYATSAAGEKKGLSLAEVRGKFEAMMGMRLERYRTVGAQTGSAVGQAGAPPAPPRRDAPR